MHWSSSISELLPCWGGLHESDIFELFLLPEVTFAQIPKMKHNKTPHTNKVYFVLSSCWSLVSSYFRISRFLFLSPDEYFNTTFGTINPGLVSPFNFSSCGPLSLFPTFHIYMWVLFNVYNFTPS